MKRPDQDQFDTFARHFEGVDAQLESFCKENNLRLEKNFLRQPGRVLKQEGSPTFLVDIALSEHWLKIKFEADMPHTITVVGYYEQPDSAYVWRIANEIVSRERFSILQDRILDHLQEAIRLIGEWTPEVIMQKGQRSENLKQKFSQ
jgi:hypothetical protein